MNNIIRFAVGCFLIATACNKSNSSSDEDYGCIERITVPLTAHEVEDTEVRLIDSLFIKNYIDNTHLRYVDVGYGIFPDSDSTTLDFNVVTADQYINGLRVFSDRSRFHFLGKRSTWRTCQYTVVTSIPPIPELGLSQIRNLYLNAVEQFDDAVEGYEDSCFTAEFGYYDLNRDSSSRGNLIPAWCVTVKNGSYPLEFPVVYYRDNGELIKFEKRRTTQVKSFWSWLSNAISSDCRIR